MIPRSNFVSLSGVLTDVAYENINNVLFFFNLWIPHHRHATSISQQMEII